MAIRIYPHGLVANKQGQSEPRGGGLPHPAARIRPPTNNSSTRRTRRIVARTHLARLPHKPLPRLRVVRQVAQRDLAALQAARLRPAAADGLREPVLARPHAEVRQRDLERVARPDVREAEEGRAQLVGRDPQLEVAPVEHLVPVQVRVVRGEEVALAVGGGHGGFARGRGRGDGRAGELDAEVRARVAVVGEQVGDPVCVAVAGEHDGVVDGVAGEVVQRAVAVRLVPVPLVVVVGVAGAVDDGLVEAREDGLRADEAPGGAARGARGELVVQPVLLPRAHHRAPGVVGDRVDVVRVPVQVGDGPVVLPRVEHHQVEQLADAEGAPDAQVVVHLDLPDRHPLEVGADCVHLHLVDGEAAVVNERGFVVGQVGGAVAVGVVGDFVVVPGGDPGEGLVGELEV